jgi:flagellar biosynthesis GTPase FlhF
VFTNPMDYKNAQQKLSELRDSLDKVLGGKSEGPSRKDAEEALRAARDGAKRAKKTLLGRIKDLPVVDKITQLGAAGTVAVGTAAVTQTNIAVDETEVFVASVANDVVHERLSFPPLINNFVDFAALNSWGTGVMQEKVAKVKAEVAKVEAKVAPAESKQESQTESQTTEETSSQEPQTQEESANDSKKNGGNAEETKQDAEEVKGEEVKSEESQESEESQGEDLAEPVPENEGDESVDEIDEVKPHSDVKSDNSGMIEEMPEPEITPDNAIVASPSKQKQV